MDQDINNLLLRLCSTNKRCLYLINNFKYISNWNNVPNESNIKIFFDLVLETSSLNILEDMLQKGFNLNPIFKNRIKNLSLQSMIEFNAEFLKLLYIHGIQNFIREYTLDNFSLVPSSLKEKYPTQSKMVLSYILRDSEVFKKSATNGLIAVQYLISEPYVITHLVLKKLGDTSDILMNLSMSTKYGLIPTYNILIENSIKLKKNKDFQIKLIRKFELGNRYYFQNYSNFGFLFNKVRDMIKK